MATPVKNSRRSGRKYILLIREPYAHVFTGHTNPKKLGIALDIQEEPVSAGKHSTSNPVYPLSGAVVRPPGMSFPDKQRLLPVWLPPGCATQHLVAGKVTATCVLLWARGGGGEREEKGGRKGGNENQG